MVRRVASNSAWLIAQPLLMNVISILSTAYIARKLGAADYGAFNLGYAQIALFSPLCNLGLRAVAIRAIAENRENAREVVGVVFALRLFFTLLATLLALGWLAIPTYSTTTRLIGLAAVCSMIFQSLGVIASDVFQGFERARLMVQPHLAGGLILTVGSVAALLLGWGLPGFVAAYLLGHGSQTALQFWSVRRHYFAPAPVWNWREMRKYLRQLRPFAALSLLSNVTDAPVLDVMILGAVLGSGAVGPYTAATGLVTRLFMVPWGIADAMYPAVAGRYGRDRAEVEATVRRYVLYLVLVTAPIALWLTFAAPTVLWILYGEQYLPAAGVLQIAGWLVPLIGVSYLIRQCLAAVHQQQVVLRLSIVSGVLLVLLYGILIPLFGATGAAAAGVAREVLMLGLWMAPFAAHFRNAVPLVPLGKVGVALAVMTLPFGLLAVQHSVPAVVLASAAAFALYAGAVLALRLVDLKHLPLPAWLRPAPRTA